MPRLPWPVLTVATLVACAGREGIDRADLEPALAAISADTMLASIRILSSDAFEGRAPGTAGEDSTVAWLVAQFDALGLAPGNPDGSYVQRVELVGYTGTSTAAARVGGRPFPLRPTQDYIAVSRHDRPEINVADTEIVFVGYGVVAPEFGWDDYKGVDVRGKTVLIMVGDPPIPDPANPAELDTSIFRGKAMTYYGRWTYKYEKASEMGAAAAIIIHQTGPAGYPWEVVTGSWGQENFDIPGAAGASRVAIEGWITEARARALFAAAGRDFDEASRAAITKDFRPLTGMGSATWRVRNAVRRVQSRNVIARLEGSDSTLRDEYVVYTAHWDHSGRNPSLQGDQILNGALDNASGTAQLLEIAKAFERLPERPRRSILFLAVTAEEAGLLGAKFYAKNPLYPLNRTVANINIDGVNQWGRTSDVVVVGLGNSTLDDVLDTVVTAAGRMIVPDPEPEKGFFYRSDHFEFAKEGVPALYPDAGVNYIGKPAGWGLQKRAEYTANDYHKPTDEIKPDWDLSGAVEDARMLFEVGYRVAQAAKWPEWKPGTEFKARREAMLAGPPKQ
ncbi:MAG: M28 family peptidase [Gemmatimonadaceae bacterium]|nr:M28 family peptidase [Gemmatimonadaceae bacterium]